MEDAEESVAIEDAEDEEELSTEDDTMEERGEAEEDESALCANVLTGRSSAVAKLIDTPIREANMTRKGE